MTLVSRPVLIIDTDTSSPSDSKSRAESRSPSAPIWVKDSLEAKSRLSDPEQKFSGIFINSEILGHDALPIIRLAQALHGAVPLFIIHDGEKSPLGPDDVRSLSVRAVLKKPVDWKFVEEYFTPVVRTLRFGSATLEYLRTKGLDAESLNYAEKFVDSLGAAVRKLPLDKHEVTRDFLLDLPAQEHAVSTALITSLLCRSLSLNSERFQRVAGLASFFHDIALVGREELEEMAEAGALTPTELKEYNRHPHLGAQILTVIGGIEPIVISAVAQHHAQAGEFQRINEIVGLSDDFSKLVHRLAKRPGSDPLAEIRKSVLPKVSNTMAEAFSRIFPNRK